jgi:putative redox protein
MSMRATATFTAPGESLRAEAVTGSGFTVIVDSGEVVGPAGASPRELVLAGLIGCTGMDVASILAKKRQRPDAYEIHVEADVAETAPRVFTRIVVEHRVNGTVEFEALHRAIELSATRYCPVSAMLSRAVPIEHRYRLREPGQPERDGLVVVTAPGGSA